MKLSEILKYDLYREVQVLSVKIDIIYISRAKKYSRLKIRENVSELLF